MLTYLSDGFVFPPLNGITNSDEFGLYFIPGEYVVCLMSRQILWNELERKPLIIVSLVNLASDRRLRGLPSCHTCVRHYIGCDISNDE
jgi:hypothetical protein